MQFAERWLGIGSIVVALAAVGTVGFQLRHHHHHHHHHDDMVRRHIDFQPSNCSGAAATADQILIDNRPDPYEAVLVQADVAGCFTTSDRVEMLIDIAADGHVTRVTHRPEHPTRESRCVAKAARALVFPATGESLAIRYAFTR